MIKLLIIILISINLYSKDINIAISSNLAFVIKDIIKEFNKIYPKIHIKKTISGSTKLSFQIIHKASYDIFMSADTKFANLVYDKGFGVSKPKIYTKGKIVLISYKNINLSSMNILLDKKIKKIAIANPKLAPYGQASIDVLQNLDLYDKLQKKYIFAQNISTTLLYTKKICDVGIVAKSLLYTKELDNIRKNKTYYEIPSKLYNRINQSMVLLNNKKESKLFYDFILSKKIENIFVKYGYDRVND
jgi:molybdate transport system substrate-binding protein